MIDRYQRIGIIALLSLAASTGSLRAETLYEALAKAYNTNPNIQSQRATVRATDESVPQALSGWRPTVSVTGTGGLQRSRSSQTREQQLTQRSAVLNLTQPLYRGGRTESSTKKAEADVETARAQLSSVEQQVLLSAVTVYMDVLRDMARTQLTQNNENVLRRQLEATKDRFEVGEVTRTDVAQAEARLSNARAAKVSAEGDLAISKATFERVMGYPAGDMKAAPPLPPLPDSLEASLEIAAAENPDLGAARWTEVSAGHDVRTNFGNLLPQVNLVGEVSRSDETSLEDVSSRSESLEAQVRVPLYQAGAVYSQVRQAKQTRNRRRIEIETAHRRTMELTRQAWERLTATRSQIVAREEQVQANRIALEGVRQEAAVGSRTTLDVLDAEQELLDSQVALVVAERDEYVAGFQLLSAIGRLTAGNLKLDVELYDPSKHLEEVRGRLWGLTPPEE
jgi:outer membrane protein